MKYAAAAFISAMLTMGFTAAVMDDRNQLEIDRVRVVEFNAGWSDGYNEAKLGN